jgi:hypothetical protein
MPDLLIELRSEESREDEQTDRIMAFGVADARRMQRKARLRAICANPSPTRWSMRV